LNSTELDLQLNRPLPAKYGQMCTSKNFSATATFLLKINCFTFFSFYYSYSSFYFSDVSFSYS